jgi:hypothetical protein
MKYFIYGFIVFIAYGAVGAIDYRAEIDLEAAYCQGIEDGEHGQYAPEIVCD